MKLTKYAQSCFLLEDKKIKILLDPGFLLLNEQTIKEWMNPDFILVTHKHQDHFFEEAVSKITSAKTKIYATKETANSYPNTKFEIIQEKDKFKLAELTIEVVHAIHGYNPLLKGGKEAKEEVGYIIDTGKQKIYHTGDTICFNNDYKCEIILLPFTGYGLTMAPFEAALFAKETGAKLIIPMHYDNPKYPVDMKRMEEELQKNELKYKILKIGESIEV
ncbi:MAG: MBL fold metallo-hydrolase [archaeon]|jgi:L-ascorbate metabolism protein UlaG (beta-lactamase superfamily)